MSLVQGEVFYLHTIVEIVGGTIGEDSECSARDTTVRPQVLLRKGTGVIINTSDRLLYSDYNASAGPNGGDLYEFIVEAVESKTTAMRKFFCYADHGAATQKIAYVHHAYLGKEHPTPLLLLHSSSGTASTSRIADLMPLRWRPGLGWSPGRRLRCRFTIDTSLTLTEGTLLGGEDQSGTMQAALVRLAYDSGVAEYRIQISDGTAAWVAPVAVPQAAECTISVDAGPAGANVTVQGTKATTSSAFNFSWVDETYIGSLPDGTDHVGIPLNIEPEVV